ncbi:MAG: GGDEF domain-containing protein [Planctomycetota bacterium]|nr:GGDEF domain-containing protein [Planctomycetota bacterium]
MHKTNSSFNVLYILILVPSIVSLSAHGTLLLEARPLLSNVTLSIALGLLVFKIRSDYFKVLGYCVTDALTGLSNIRQYRDDMNVEVDYVNKNGLCLLSVYFDLDGFKLINDQLGHETGNFVLKRVGAMLRESVRRQADGCYRIGGDEFLIVMSRIHPDDLVAIRSRIAKLVLGIDEFLKEYGASLSYGMSELREGESEEELLRRADQKMYFLKAQRREARNKVQLEKSA